MANKKLLSPGQKSPDSGQGKIVGPRGGKTNNSEVTLVKGKTVPPTPEPGQKIKITDPTKHKK
jgi:hypothetical protein